MIAKNNWSIAILNGSSIYYKPSIAFDQATAIKILKLDTAWYIIDR